MTKKIRNVIVLFAPIVVGDSDIYQDPKEWQVAHSVGA
jgi:hypothetical protein